MDKHVSFVVRSNAFNVVHQTTCVVGSCVFDREAHVTLSVDGVVKCPISDCKSDRD